MKRIFIILLLIVASLYFFPFAPTFLPAMNTKMMMAGIGLIVIGFQLAKGQKPVLDKDFLIIAGLAALVSIIGFAAITYNSTPDYAYALYIVSMLVWLSAANVVVSCIRQLHGRVTVGLVCDYLIAISVLQCAIAIWADMSPAVKNFIDSLVSGQGFMGKSDYRLYGIGCSLDVAGIKFCAVLLMIADRLRRVSINPEKRYLTAVYLAAFMFISIVGNMMARTTTIGVIMAIAYLIITINVDNKAKAASHKYLWTWCAVSLVAAVTIATILYNTNPMIRSNIRFGFEGFFSLVEEGKWEVHSNELLKNMVVFPDDLKTWIIGNGYFENPSDTDPYYNGVQWKGFYQNTDIGYLRFIFYFGIFGLLAFMGYFIKVGTTCIKRFNAHKMFFTGLLVLNFIVWCKVSTDVFVVFALFLCLREEEWDSVRPLRDN